MQMGKIHLGLTIEGGNLFCTMQEIKGNNGLMGYLWNGKKIDSIKITADKIDKSTIASIMPDPGIIDSFRNNSTEFITALPPNILEVLNTIPECEKKDNVSIKDTDCTFTRLEKSFLCQKTPPEEPPFIAP